MYVLFTLTTTNDLQYGVFLVTFNGVLLILMVWSIAASILLTSAFLTGSHPGVELQLFGVKRSGLLNLVRLLTFFLSLLVPTTLIYQLARLYKVCHSQVTGGVLEIPKIRGSLTFEVRGLKKQ